MNTSLYSAFLGMRARQRALDATANNIANASTAGFKAERILYRTIAAAESQAQRAQNSSAGSTVKTPAAPTVQTAATAQTSAQAANQSDGIANPDVRSTGVVTSGATDFTPGAVRETGRALDVALDGDGFLVVQTPRGERYMRAGNLTLDNAGQLVTQRGEMVVGESGPITIPPGEVAIGEDGTISVGGRTIDRLKVVRFDNPQAALVKEGDSMFVATGKETASAAEGARVMQGTLEVSNVNTVTEMVAMMQNNREFEALQHSITMMRELGRKVMADVGKI